MSKLDKPKYDFKNPIFKNGTYRRWANEHIYLSEIESDVIHWEVKETDTPLRIPVKYHIHYKIKSIIGIDESQNPIFSKYHVMELTLPLNYPYEPCKIYMLTPTWHPNIKSTGVHKGRICGNVKNFGKAFDLYQMVIRVGEILQYKNYHAQHIPPYPEDSTVAHWVTTFAEPNGILNLNEGIYIDDSPLLRLRTNDEPAAKPTPKVAKPTVKIDPPKPEKKEELPKPITPKVEDKSPTEEVPKTTPPTPKKDPTPISKTPDVPKVEKPPKIKKTIKLGSIRKTTSKIKLQIKKRDEK